MSQQRPQSNFFQTLLMVTVIFLAVQMFLGTNTRVPDTSTLQETLDKMRQLNAQVRDDSISRLKPVALGKLAELEKKKEIQPEVAERIRLEIQVLVSDTLLKAGTRLRDFNKLTLAYNDLSSLESRYRDDAVWREPFRVGPDKDFPRTETSAEALKELAGNKLRELGMATPVWGFFPGYQMVDFLVRITGAIPSFSYAFAGLLLAIFVRALVWPLAQKQLMFGRQMAQLQPLAAELREKYTGQELQQKTMELYREYGINPMAGCLPALIQMPLFLLIYTSMLHYRFEFEKGTFLWIGSPLSEKYPWFFATNLGHKDYLLIILYGISMVVTTLLTPVSDPNNARQQRLMGISIAVLFAILMFFWPVPSAFVLYWIFTNILATFQSLRAYRLPVPPLVKVNAPGGGVFPVDPNSVGAVRTGAPKVHRAKKKSR
ncbi:MAG: YidC/Oxa1 family membrane protein insertase [Fimbriimonadales bacterium]|nr:YidC/Oxa1 family membrane protein insertase [Fimbriimonadales bacterium]